MISGQWLKSIRFKQPIIENDLSIGLDNGEHVETVVRLVHKETDMVPEPDFPLCEEQGQGI